MKAVENDTDRIVVGPTDDFPGVAIIVDVTSPGQRLVSDAQTARGGALAKLAKIQRGAIDAAEGNRRNVATNQHQIGLQFLHQVELALGAREIPPALWLRHTFEVAKRLECADFKPKVAAHRPDVARATAE